MYKVFILLILVALIFAKEETPAARPNDQGECNDGALPLMAGPTKAGELKLFQFADGQVVDPYAFRVGVPPNVTDHLRNFCLKMDFPKIFADLMGPEGYDPGDSEYVRIKGKKWFIQRPAKKWNSNSHWLNPTDEKAHDHFLRVLGDGGFDVVLDAIGRHFGLETLILYSVGFFVVNHCEDGWMHDDFNDVDGKAFNVLIPLKMANESASQVLVESRDDSNVIAAVDYQYDVAVGVGDNTRHAAGNCDYRESGEVRLMATLYLADINEGNVKSIVKHYTDPFPPATVDYLLKWRGLHWKKDGSAQLPRDWLSHTRTDLSLMPGPTEPGELTLLQFADGTPVDPYAFRVAFPDSLTQALQAFCNDMGFYKLFQELMTPDGAYGPGEGETVRFNGQKWQIQRPAKKWHSNSHWLNPMDEEADDQFLRVLGDGGFDVVLDAIGKQFGLGGLTCYSVGFFVVNHCEDGWMHDDFKKVDGSAFNLLLPVELAKTSIAELKVESVDYSKDTVKVRYERNVAVGVGDYTRHATGDCDYRETGEMRVMVTIYLAEITRSNVKNIIQHYTDDWPPADEDYLLTRSDIHWTSDGLTKLPRGPPRAESKQALLPGPTKSGEVLPLQFKDEVAVDPFAFRVGLPKNLTKTMKDYCDKIGLTKLFGDLMGPEQLDPDEDKYVKLNGNDWYIQRPSEKFDTTAHWLSTSSEEAQEEYLQVLGEGGFDAVLDGIGNYFDLDGLACYSLGFVVLNQCHEGSMYYDFKQVSGKAFTLLFPIVLPVAANEASAQHYVRTRSDSNVVAKVDYEHNVALGVGDYTRHTTGDMDYHDSDSIIVLATIYIADFSADKQQNILKEFSDPFPPKKEEYFLQLKGAHWKRDDPTVRLPRPGTHRKPNKTLQSDSSRKSASGLQPGKLSLLKFEDGHVVDPFAFRIGLPPNLTSVLRGYCDATGLTKLFKELMGPEQLDPDEDDYVELDGTSWYIQRPSEEKFHTNAHWLNPADEKGFEQYLNMLAEGGFGVVLEGIGRHFGLDGLTCYSVGFSVLDQCEEGFTYYDFRNVDGKAFSLMIPIWMEDHLVSQHVIRSSTDATVLADVDYEYNQAIGVGDDTKHNTGNIDYRSTRGMLVMATIYVADINEDNVFSILKDFTDSFPPNDEEYFLKQRGRHWNKEGSAQLPSRN